MSSLSVSFSDEVALGLKAETIEDCWGIEMVVQKTQSIWYQIYEGVTGNLLKVVHVARNAIGSVIRDAFFFPLKCARITNSETVQNLLQIEETYYRNFWDLSKPVDPALKSHARIRELFDPPEDRIF